MFHIVQPYGPQGDYRQATVVATLPKAEAAWEYLDALRVRMVATGANPESVELVVVDEWRRVVGRPQRTVQ